MTNNQVAVEDNTYSEVSNGEGKAAFNNDSYEEVTNNQVAVDEVSNSQGEAAFNNDSYEEVGDNEATVEDRPYAYAEVGDNQVAVEDNTYGEVSNSQGEAAFDRDSEVEVSDNEVTVSETEETEQPQSSLPVGAATRLQLDEPPIQEMVSPATTLQLPELPKAVLIDRETEEKITLPPEEKTAYIGRLNDEFPIQVDLSNIDDADLISRVHAAIHHERDTYYIEDAGSANGTWLNEEKIQPGIRFRKQLNSGDTIAFGRNQTIKFTFDLED